MADSFFGFNASLDEIDDGGGALEASEDEYDALNDETFGEMVDDGDWEQQHEEFSLLTENSKHMDIEETLSNLILDNDDKSPMSSLLSSNRAANKQPNYPVRQISSLSNLPPIPSLKNICTVEELERHMRQQQQPQQQNPGLPVFQPRFPSGIMAPPPPLMGNQPFAGHPPNQPMPFRMPQPPPNHYGNFNMMPPNNMPPGNGPIRPPMGPGMDQHPPFHQMHFNQQSNNFNNQNNMNQQRFPMNNQQMPLNKQQQFPHNQQQPIHNQQFPHSQRFPQNQQQFPMNQQQGIMNHPPAMNQQQMPPNHHLNQQRPPQNQQMNNRNQHQNNMNQNVHNQHQPNKLNMNSNNNRPFSNYNNSNGPNTKSQNDTNNLIQMIQNTHPMLQNNMHSGYMNAFIANPLLAHGIVSRHLNNMPPGFNNQGGMQRNNDNHRRPAPDADPYSGLMSTRQKQWILTIQMMQLNTGTPYIDDFYYTVFLERKTKKQKEVVKEAHKMNQENHPFSQKNLQNNKFNQYNNHGNDGEHRRERCNSTRSNSDNPPQNKDGPRIYKPTQFENSLGKLQCGSVTAPRKIIDMEVIGRESPTGEVRNNAIGSSTAGVIGAPRGTRHILLAIETLYRILLRLEDLSEPLAIANAVILKEREEKQKALLLEQQQMENIDKQDDDDDASSPGESSNNFLRDIESVQKQKSDGAGSLSTNAHNSILPQTAVVTLPNLLDENKPDLLGKLFAGLLFEDRLSSFMNIRKGKMLVIRILAQAVPTERWRAPLGRMWPRLLRALPYASRRDTHILNQLVDHFQQYLYGTEGWAPVSDLCLLLSEESSVGPVSNQRASTIPFRSITPSLPSRSLMHFIMSTTLGLSMIAALMERASVLPKPAPAAWNNMVKCAGRLVTASGNARPLNPLPRSLISAHCASAELTAGVEESLFEVLAQPPQIYNTADL